MFKKTMTYTDYNGVTKTKDLYFNLTKSELLMMELSTEGGYTEMIENIVNSKSVTELIKIFEELVLKSYGEKSPDGERFIKNDEIREAFTQTECYNDLFFELATNTEAANAFVEGVMPQALVEEMLKSKASIDKESTTPALTPVN